jgi:acyl-CoA dehydrogenase
MNFDCSDKSQQLLDRLQAFFDEHIYPVEQEYIDAVHNNPDRWSPLPMMEELKQKAKDAGLWNLFLPEEHLPYGAGLSNLE